MAGLGFIGVIFLAALLLGVAWLIASTPGRGPLFVGLALAGSWWGVAFGFMTFGSPDATGAMLAQSVGAAFFGAGLFLFVGAILWAVHRQHLWPIWLQHAMHPGRRWNTRHVRAIARRLEPLVASTSAPDSAPKPARARALRRAS